MPTVLIVDDEAIVRNLVRITLSRAGYAVMDANGASEAGVLCRSMGNQHVDLLIIDHRLVGGIGREFADEILASCPASKVLVISAWPYQDVQDEKGIAPGSTFLQKPFTAQQLLVTVEHVLFPSTQ
jgi:DNA-binding NtrC family response regulator